MEELFRWFLGTVKKDDKLGVIRIREGETTTLEIYLDGKWYRVSEIEKERKPDDY